jgi:hypothetical protein
LQSRKSVRNFRGLNIVFGFSSNGGGSGKRGQGGG